MTELITSVNATNIVSIRVADERPYSSYKYGSYTFYKWNWKQFKFIQVTQKGFYYDYDVDHTTTFYTKEELLKYGNVVITEDNKVFYKAYVETCFVDKKCLTKHFNSYVEALNYYTNLCRKIPNNINL